MSNQRAEGSLAHNVNEISSRLRSGIDAMNTICCAMGRCSYEAQQFASSLFYVLDCLDSIQKELDQEVEAAFASGRKEAAQCQEQP